MINIEKSYYDNYSSLMINSWIIYFDDLEVRRSRSNKKTIPDLVILMNTKYSLLLCSNFRGNYTIDFTFILKD